MKTQQDIQNPLAVTPEMTAHALDGFHAPAREWFQSSFPSITKPQALGWPVIQSGAHTLILSPTGSGKTLTAFMSAIDRLMFEPVPPKDKRCRVIYLSPLKALAVDVERNLRAPLVGVTRQAERMGIEAHIPEVATRTGDTPSRDRAAFNRNPADILITTPESLYLMLTSQAREAFRSVEVVIIDEIHAMVSTKRGAHLSLSLERLAEITEKPFQRIGLSATQKPLDEVARFLGGSEEGEYRPIQIVDAGQTKTLDILVEVPVEDMARIGVVDQYPDIPSGAASQGLRGQRALYPDPSSPNPKPDEPQSAIQSTGSIWPAIHPLILNLIRAHRSTLIFVNSRRLAERMASALNELAGEEIVHAHHGSVAREQRQLIEDELKSGKLPAMVATSTLELGIDMGAIDLVIQVEAPPSVASGLQRIGRAGHQIGVPSKGIILPKYRGDLLACAALTDRMVHGQVEPLRYPRNPLDILAQQIVAMVSMDDWSVDHLEEVVRRSAPFRDLPRNMLEQTLDMLSGRYPSDDFAELRPRITWDRLNNVLHSREGAKRIAISNGGTIPDRGLYGVFLVGAERGHGRVGELDEEMVFESRVGDVFLLGASSWRIEDITHDRVLVSPATGQPGRMPFWHGERAGRPLEFGRAIGALSRNLRSMPEEEGMELLTTKHALADTAARNLIQYLEDQHAAAGAVPDDKSLVIESYMDEMGDWRVCILSPFGSRVHAPWAMAIGAIIRDRLGEDTDILWTDDGIVVRMPETDEPPPPDLFIPDPEEVEDMVIRQLGIGGGGAHEAGQGAPVNAMFASRFRESAARALLLPRKHPGQRSPMWQQRKRAADLLNATARFGSFPIILETFRECLQDVFDMPALIGLLRDIRSREIKLATVTTRTPSPFAASLMFNYVANFIYEGDAPLAERRAQALLIDPSQLRELLGEAELRELIDPGSLASVELTLQYLTQERAVRHADGLHDLLIRLGDLSTDEIRARSLEGAGPELWISELERERRIIPLLIAGEPRYVAIEDAAKYRDAFGVPLPQGLPATLLDEAPDALYELVARYARTHGPFTPQEIARRFGSGVGPVLGILRSMAEKGRVVEGEFRPGGAGSEWCDSNVLRALRQKSLARLRQEVEPADQSALARLYLSWQSIRIRSSSTTPRTPSLLDTIEQLQDASIPASLLETQILPARLGQYDPRALDALMSSGEVIWVGCESLGQHDGRISLYFTDHASLLWTSSADGPTGTLHNAIREHLMNRGASFFPQIVQAVGGFSAEVLEAIWDLVWAGEVTNDTLQPLRAVVNPPKSHTREREERSRRAPLVVRGRAIRPTLLGQSRTTPPEAVGRWSLVSSLLYGEPTATERLTGRVQQLLDRFGIVTREAAQAAGFEGGFTAVYGVLKAMEEAGRVRRGYFVSGLGATQFALPGVVDRLRALREPEERPESVILSTVDPANPYGTALPWPERPEGRRPMRIAGSQVILVDGYLAAWMAKGERQLLTFPDSVGERDPETVKQEIARVLAAEVGPGKRRAIMIEEADGQPIHSSAMAPALLEAGFIRTNNGYLKRL